jgi:hypothetical protein
MSDATESTGVSQFSTLPILVIWLGANFGRQHIPPMFFSKACVLKNTSAPKLLNSMAKHWSFHFSKGDGKNRPWLLTLFS